MTLRVPTNKAEDVGMVAHVDGRLWLINPEG
jgi:hypothetical protein